MDSATGRDWIKALAADPLTLRWLLRGLAGGGFADIAQHPHMLEAVFRAGCIIRRERITTEKQPASPEVRLAAAVLQSSRMAGWVAGRASGHCPVYHIV